METQIGYPIRWGCRFLGSDKDEYLVEGPEVDRLMAMILPPREPEAPIRSLLGMLRFFCVWEYNQKLKRDLIMARIEARLRALEEKTAA